MDTSNYKFIDWFENVDDEYIEQMY